MIKKVRTTPNADENQRNWSPHRPWWEREMVRLLWKSTWQFFTKLNVKLSHGTVIALVGTYPRDIQGYSHAKSAHACF